MQYDFLIVGAGFAGCVLAERLSSCLDKKVLLIDRRNHVGGNAFDFYNADGILVQKYGPHIFHTTYDNVWKYLGKFTEWNNYVHRVIAKINNKEIYLPINCESMEILYERKFSVEEMRQFFIEKRINVSEIKTARDVVVSQVGSEIYELIFKDYTKKQWGVYPEELDVQVTQRLLARFNRDTRYFTDKYQGMPKYGFAILFKKMLDHKGIHVLLKTDYNEIKEHIIFNKIIYTGSIDEFFNYKYGTLPYRSLDFEFCTLNMFKYQNAGVVNFPSIQPAFTRITEFKHLYLQQHDETTICFEYPKTKGEPYYPIPQMDCRITYEKYKAESSKLKSVFFLGRLAEYEYLNMDQVVYRALKLFEMFANE